MAKTLYMRFQPVGLLENFPGSLQETIIYNGLDTGQYRYYEVFGTSSPGDRDYLEFTISTMTFTKPADLNQQGTVAREGGVETYNYWITKSVPDNFVIPTAPAPDLKVVLKSLTPTTLPTTGQLDFNFDLINAGNATANFTHLGFYLSTDKIITTSDTLLLDFDNGSLPSNTQYGILFGAPLPSLYQPVGPGKYWVGIIVDYDNKVPNESKEDNNVSNAIQITVTGTAANNPHTGGVTITGTPLKGATLTADTSTLQDADGLGALTYQWQHSVDGNTWTNVGINAKTYVVAAGDVGDYIRVVVSYTDKKSHAETAESLPTVKVTEALLFTPASNTVNFNALDPDQKAAAPLADLYHANSGDDVVRLPNTANFLTGVKLTWKYPAAPDDWFQGQNGNDRILGGVLADRIDGGDDNDVLVGAIGADILKGGAGDDLILGDILFPGETLEAVTAATLQNGHVYLPKGGDTAVFSGPRSNYVITEMTGGLLKVVAMSGTDGTDILRDITFLDFTDGPPIFAPGRAAVTAVGDKLAGSLISKELGGMKWAPVLSGDPQTVLTYSFAQSAGSFASDYWSMLATASKKNNLWASPHFTVPATPAVETAVRAIYDHLELYTDLKFTRVEESAHDVGTLRFIGMSDLTGDTLGIGYAPGLPPAGGDLVLSTSYNGSTFLPGSEAWATLVHEILHTLGISHELNTKIASTMYKGVVKVPGSTLDYGLQPVDLYALQLLYGAKDSHAGDTTWNSLHGENSGLHFDDQAAFSETIYDPSGINTMDWSALATHQVLIDLNEGALSYVRTADTLVTTATVGIGYGSKFQKAIGGAEDDSITGNPLNNELRGGGGDDVLIGGLGADHLYGGADADVFRFTKLADAADTIFDFVSGEDKIGIARAGFGIAPKVGLGNGFDFQQLYFVSGASPVATEAKHGQFLFDTMLHQLLWDADGTGTKSAPVLLATLANGAEIHASDFVLVA